MKKVLSILLVTLLAFSAMSIMAVNAVDPTVSLETVTGKAGEQVEVNLNVANNPGLTALQVKFTYSATDVSINKATAVAPFTPVTTNIKNANHNPFLVQYDFEEAVEGDGTVCKLTFDVLEGAKASDLTITSVSAFDDNMKKVTFATVNGKINIESAPIDPIQELIDTPIVPVAADETAFKPANGFASGLELIGAQKKIKDSDVRFITAVSKDVLAQAVDYGYIFAQTNAAPANDKIKNFTYAKAAKKYSCVGTTCELAGDFGDPAKGTDYTYVTCCVNNIKSGKTVTGRFYVETEAGTTYYYAKTADNVDGLVYSVA